MRITEAELASLNERFQAASPLEILSYVHEVFRSRAAILSSMQWAGSVLCHMADRAQLAFDVVFVDTGVLHVETLKTRDALRATHPNLRVVTLSPKQSFVEQTRDKGLLYLTREGQQECCDLRKTVPLLEMKGRYDVLLSTLRRDEGGARSRVTTFGLDVQMNALRVHPFAHVTREELLEYVKTHPDVTMNPLHAMGFPSIGCFTCTTPVREDEPERAGRWRHLAGIEYCGINPVDRGGAAGSVEISDEYSELLR